MGVQLKSEQVNTEMIEIMDELHGYVAKKTTEATFESRAQGISVTYTKDYLHPILFGGDQLTCARARSCQRARMNSDCASDGFLGLVPCCEDWHTKMTFLSVSMTVVSVDFLPLQIMCKTSITTHWSFTLERLLIYSFIITTMYIQVIWKRLYKPASFLDAGTLYHLRNTVHRTNVTGQWQISSYIIILICTVYIFGAYSAYTHKCKHTLKSLDLPLQVLPRTTSMSAMISS